MPSKCAQCEKPGFYDYGDSGFLCVDCHLKVVLARQSQLSQEASRLNYLYEQAEATVGMTGIFPRLNVPQPIQAGPMTNHNIHIDNSVIGAVNTGQIMKMNVALDHIHAAGNPRLADDLKTFTETVLGADELSPDAKKAIAEHLEYLIKQASLSPEQRQSAMAKSVMAGLESMLSISASILNLWGSLKLSLEAFFF